MRERTSKKIIGMVTEKIIPGASWSFFSEGEWLSHYAGVMGVGPQFSTKVIQEGLFYDLASLTKVVGTTTRILQLIGEGSLAFETPVNKVIPDYEGITATLGDLLLHRGGFPADFSKKETLTKASLTAYFEEWKASESVHPMVYSDVGFLLLGEVIQTIDQRSLEQSFYQNIFEPLAMADTGYHLKDKSIAVPTESTVQRGIIQGEVHDSKAYRLEAEVGSAGLFSTLADLNKFVSAYLVRDERLFSHKLFDKVRSTVLDGRTYGWEQKQGRTGAYLFHTGFTGTSIGLSIEKQKGFVLLTNRIHPNRRDNGFILARSALYNGYF